MTEAEWLRSVNSQAMMAVVRSKGSERLWRLFAVACVRGAEDRMCDARSRKALEVAERFADGQVTLAGLLAARAQAQAAAYQAFCEEYEAEAEANFRLDAAYEASRLARLAADAALVCVAEAMDIDSIPPVLQHPDLFREVFGNPFQWKIVAPTWLSWNGGLVRKLAEEIYDNRSFGLLPIHADALEDAGCSDADILTHLRGPGPHVRGCWAVDLILGKE